jgi:hypothetical protein
MLVCIKPHPEDWWGQTNQKEKVYMPKNQKTPQKHNFVIPVTTTVGILNYVKLKKIVKNHHQMQNGSFNLVRNAKLVHADGNVLIAMIFIVQNVFHMCMPEGTEPVTNTRCCPIIPLKWNGQG